MLRIGYGISKEVGARLVRGSETVKSLEKRIHRRLREPIKIWVNVSDIPVIEGSDRLLQSVDYTAVSVRSS